MEHIRDRRNDTNDVQQRISQTAFAIWEAQGRPDGQSLDNWLVAEKNILARISVSMARHAIRMMFRMDGEQIVIIEQERLAMVVPLSSELEHSAPRSGCWYELLDNNGNPIYRRVMHNPMSTYVEVPTGDPDRPMAYQKVDRLNDIFSILIPHVAESKSVAIFASEPQLTIARSLDLLHVLAHKRAYEARKIAHFDLHYDSATYEHLTPVYH